MNRNGSYGAAYLQEIQMNPLMIATMARRFAIAYARRVLLRDLDMLAGTALGFAAILQFRRARFPALRPTIAASSGEQTRAVAINSTADANRIV
jgi:hypothetical protein